jgi:hypothetical protein
VQGLPRTPSLGDVSQNSKDLQDPPVLVVVESLSKFDDPAGSLALDRKLTPDGGLPILRRLLEVPAHTLERLPAARLREGRRRWPTQELLRSLPSRARQAPPTKGDLAAGVHGVDHVVEGVGYRLDPVELPAELG